MELDRRLLLGLSAAGLASSSRRSSRAWGAGPAGSPAPTIPVVDLWISRANLLALPTSGAPWEAVLSASGRLQNLDLSNQDDGADVRLLAAALVASRTEDNGLRSVAVDLVERAPGTEDGGETLALARNLQALLVAADVLGHGPRSFCSWVRGVMRETLDGRTLISTHEERPNNWGTHAGAARLLADLFLLKYGSPEQREEALSDGLRAVKTWRRWLGNRSARPEEFKFGELDWQSDPDHPVGVNPAGATIQGHSVDGVLPDDQRRVGSFAWPPPPENYVYEALQGAVVAATVMARSPIPGPAVWGWSDRALLRAWRWLHDQASFPPEGDDEWITPLVNRAYGTAYPVGSPSSAGKGMAWTAWTHAGP